jgi:hypothetical protein
MKIQPKYIAALMGVATLVGVCGTASALEEKPSKTSEKQAAAGQSVYACPDCHAMALKAGACPTCKKEMSKMHLLGTKDGQATVCTCNADCKCDAKGVKDGQCACGKPVQMIRAKGMYVCPMGCPKISAKAGKCACGMDMKKVE